MKSDWENLPNAPYIIRILESVKVDPSVWASECPLERADAWNNILSTSPRKILIL